MVLSHEVTYIHSTLWKIKIKIKIPDSLVEQETGIQEVKVNILQEEKLKKSQIIGL